MRTAYIPEEEEAIQPVDTMSEADRAVVIAAIVTSAAMLVLIVLTVILSRRKRRRQRLDAIRQEIIQGK